MARRVRVNLPGDTKRYCFYGERRYYHDDEFDLVDKDGPEPIGSYMVPLNFEAPKFDKSNFKETDDYKAFLEWKKAQESKEDPEESNESDVSRDELVEEYTSLFGKAPHPSAKDETIQAKINEKLEE